MCFGLQGPISGERRHSRAPRGAYFEHLSNTSSTQVLDCSNTSSCQSNSRPYPGNPGLTLDVAPCRGPKGQISSASFWRGLHFSRQLAKSRCQCGQTGVVLLARAACDFSRILTVLRLKTGNFLWSHGPWDDHGHILSSSARLRCGSGPRCRWT